MLNCKQPLFKTHREYRQQQGEEDILCSVFAREADCVSLNKVTWEDRFQLPLAISIRANKSKFIHLATRLEWSKFENVRVVRMEEK